MSNNRDKKLAKKYGDWWMKELEIKFRKTVIPSIPSQINSVHMTLLTAVWAFLNIIIGYYASYNLSFLYLITFTILIQYATDSLDGALGKYRNEGLIKWGFYMDHFLDYFFGTSILLAYGFVLNFNHIFFLILAMLIYSAFMINAFLYFGATGNFKVSTRYKFGTSEIRIVLIAFILITTILGKDFINTIFPYVTIISGIALIYKIYDISKEMWKLDMENKNKT